MRQRSPDFWAKVRTVNWILGGVGLATTTFFSLVIRTHGINGHYRYPLPTETRRVTHTPDNASMSTVNYLAFTGDNRTVIGSVSVRRPERNWGRVYAWDAATGKKLWEAATPGSAEYNGAVAALMPDQASVVTVGSVLVRNNPGEDSSNTKNLPGRYKSRLALSFRDARTGRQLAVAHSADETEPRLPVSIDVAPDGQSVAVASADRIDVWQRDEKYGSWIWHKVTRPADRQSMPISRAQFIASGKSLVVLSAGYDDQNRVVPYADVLDTRTGALSFAFGKQTAPARGGMPFHYSAVMAALSPDRRSMTTFYRMGDSYQFGLYNVETGRFTQSPPAVPSPIVFSSNLMFVPRQGRTRRNLESTKSTVAVTVLAAGRKASNTPTLLYWDLPANQVRRAASADSWGPASTDAFSADGRLAAIPESWHGEHLVALRDAKTGRPIRYLD